MAIHRPIGPSLPDPVGLQNIESSSKSQAPDEIGLTFPMSSGRLKTQRCVAGLPWAPDVVGPNLPIGHQQRITTGLHLPIGPATKVIVSLLRPIGMCHPILSGHTSVYSFLGARAKYLALLLLKVLEIVLGVSGLSVQPIQSNVAVIQQIERRE